MNRFWLVILFILLWAMPCYALTSLDDLTNRNEFNTNGTSNGTCDATDDETDVDGDPCISTSSSSIWTLTGTDKSTIDSSMSDGGKGIQIATTGTERNYWAQSNVFTTGAGGTGETAVDLNNIGSDAADAMDLVQIEDGVDKCALYVRWYSSTEIAFYFIDQSATIAIKALSDFTVPIRIRVINTGTGICSAYIGDLSDAMQVLLDGVTSGSTSVNRVVFGETSATSGNNFDASFDYLAYDTSVKYPTLTNTPYTLSDSLWTNIEGRWRLSSSWQDDTINNNSLLEVTSDVTSGAGHGGRSNHSALFNSTEGLKIYYSIMNGLDISGNITISAWVYPTSVTGSMQIAGRFQTTAKNYILWLSSGVPEFSIGDGSSWQHAIGATTLNINTWYHIVSVWDGTDIRVYVNNALDSNGSNNPKSFSGSMSLENSDFNIGCKSSDCSSFNFLGRIDDVAVWSRALSSSEVTILYNMKDDFADKFILGIGDSIAEGHPNYHGPEHTGPSGDINSQIWPKWASILDYDYYNGGIGGDKSSDVDSRIQALLTSQYPDYVYVHVGINDMNYVGNLTTYLTNLSSIRTKILNSGASMVLGQIIPWTNGTETQQKTLKQWNAAIEIWCIQNNVKLAPTYQEMADITLGEDDNLDNPYSADGIHPTILGYTRLGELYAYSSVPNMSLTWGHSSFYTYGYESWRWFVLSGSASINGNSDTGTLILPQNDTADGPVKTLGSGTKNITLSSNVSSGTADIYYRTNTNNFNRNDGASWTLYSSPVITTDEFIQIRYKGTSAGSANVDDARVSWVVMGYPIYMYMQ